MAVWPVYGCMITRQVRSQVKSKVGVATTLTMPQSPCASVFEGCWGKCFVFFAETWNNEDFDGESLRSGLFSFTWISMNWPWIRTLKASPLKSCKIRGKSFLCMWYYYRVTPCLSVTLVIPARLSLKHMVFSLRAQPPPVRWISYLKISLAMFLCFLVKKVL